MPSVIYTEKAKRLLMEFVAEHMPDETLLQRFEAYLMQVAEFPASMTEIAKFPYKSDRLMTNFELADESGKFWTFTVTLTRTPDEEGIIIRTINGGPN